MIEQKRYNIANILTERKNKGEIYYYIDDNWCFKIKHENHSSIDDKRWNIGNYFNDEDEIINFIERAITKINTVYLNELNKLSI